MKIRSVGAEMFHVSARMDRSTDIQTDKLDEAHSRFSQFSENTKKKGQNFIKRYRYGMKTFVHF
jgi:hypothetical protein